LQSFRTPTDAQAALTNVAAGTSNDIYASSPVIMDATASGTFPAITGAITGLAITLASGARASSTTATISFTPNAAIAAGANAGIAITLSGAGIALAGGSACTVTAPSAGSAACAASLAGSVLTVRLLAGTYNPFALVAVVVTSFTAPSNAQAGLSNVAAGTSNDLSATAPAITDSTTSGTFPGISWINDLSVALASSVAATSTNATVSFTSSVALTAGANAGIAITLAGAGIALGGGSACTVTGPSSGGACAASLAGSVLTVKLTAGTYPAFTYVSVTVTSFTTPTVGQAAMANVAAGISDDLSLATPAIVAST